MHRDRFSDGATSGEGVGALGGTLGSPKVAVLHWRPRANAMEAAAIRGWGGESDNPATASRACRPSSSRRCASACRLVCVTIPLLDLDVSVICSADGHVVGGALSALIRVRGAIGRSRSGARECTFGATVVILVGRLIRLASIVVGGMGEAVGTRVDESERSGAIFMLFCAFLGIGGGGPDGPWDARLSSDRNWDDRVSILRSRASRWRASSSPAAIGGVMIISRSRESRVGPN